MVLRLVLTFLGLAIACASGERVSCRQVASSTGGVKFDCVTVVPPDHLSIQKLYILWLQSHGTRNQHNVDILVPNYKIEDVIQAAAKAGGSSAHTSINVALAKPEFSYIAQKQDEIGDLKQTYDVNLQYDRLDGTTVHFADNGEGSERYAPLREEIKSPGGIRPPQYLPPRRS